MSRSGLPLQQASSSPIAFCLLQDSNEDNISCMRMELYKMDFCNFGFIVSILGGHVRNVNGHIHWYADSHLKSTHLLPRGREFPK